MIKRLFQLQCLSLLLALSPLSAARYALLVGCNDGGKEVGALNYAETDAERFAELLGSLGGFERSAVTTLLHPDSAALDDRLHAIATLLQSSKIADNDLFLFYFSGHADGHNLMLGKSAFPLKKVQAYLDSLPSGVRIGIFDACQSGAVTTYKGGTRAEPFYLKNPSKIKGQVIIASTAPNERAQESETLKGSIFSFYWLNGLRGSADASGDRRVTLGEAYAYAYRKTIEASILSGGEAQHPMYRFNIHGEGDITLTDLSNGGGGILFDKSCEGKFLVLSDSYTDLFADFFKKNNSEWFVSLDPGNYTIVNADNGAVGLHTLTIGENRRVRFSQSMLAPNPLAESRIKGANGVARAAMSVPATSPLSTYSWGLGAGAHLSLASGRSDAPRALSFCFANSLYLREHTDLFFNFHYLTRGLNFGAEIGFDYRRSAAPTGLILGAGGGFFYNEKRGSSINDALSPSLTAHAGYAIRVNETAQFLVELPYTVLFEQTATHRIGIELRFMFSGPFREVKILHY